MRLFFIRHGETVDNIAGVYAGSTDSALTVHGVLQAQQLADHLLSTRPRLTHLFCSPLQRARKTANAIAKVQPSDSACRAVESDDLVEQHFGFYEGKPFNARSQGSGKTGKQTHYDAHNSDPGESKQAIDVRADRFLRQHIWVLLDRERSQPDLDLSVAVVSHGILLSHLWRCLLRSLPPKSVSIAPEVLAQRSELTLERLGGFSNTGYLEVSLQHAAPRFVDSSNIIDGAALEALCADDDEKGLGEENQVAVSTRSNSSPPTTVPDHGRLQGFSVTILTVNGQQHLKGVKRARGGIGRMRYDEGQKTLDNFFKRPKKA